ncbi:MAG: endonuclease domain-containing protein [bacterium]|nr:endonuclease domain-containing protein [bacterium]
MKINNEHNLIPLARAMRKHGTHGEALLWNILKQRQMCGYQFLRQRPVGRYITDFMCQRLKLIVEIDGSSHTEKATEDEKRSAFLEQGGFAVLRFSEHAVCTRRESVITAVQQWIAEHAPASHVSRQSRTRHSEADSRVIGQTFDNKQAGSCLPLEKGDARGI